MEERRTVIIYSILTLYLLSVVAALVLIFTKPRITPEQRIIPSITPIKNAIAIVNISGPIRISERPSKFFAYDAEAIIRKLRTIKDRKEIKAVVLRINSPGGSVAAVQEIYSEILRLREKDKIVIASFGDIAASGAYYLASACDKIVADPGTLTGSIGVLLQVGNIQELFKKIGVKVEIIKSGKHKDSGSMFRKLSPEEKEMFQNLVNEAYDQFIQAIVTGRKMDKTKLLSIADGRIFTGSQALKEGLIDKLGDAYDAINLAKELSKIKGKPKIIYEFDIWDRLFNIFGESKVKSSITEIIGQRKLRFEYILE